MRHGTSAPGHKWQFHCTTPSTSEDGSDPGNMHKILGVGALAGRYNIVLYHESLLARNVVFEIPTYYLARLSSLRRY